MFKASFATTKPAASITASISAPIPATPITVLKKVASKRTMTVLAASVMVVALPACNDDDGSLVIKTAPQYGDYGTQTALTLARNYSGRFMGSDKELAAAKYMQQRMTFSNNGDVVELQPFEFVASDGALEGQAITSHNVVVTHKGTDDSGKTIYVGAHYDAATQYPNYQKLEALDDNASGAGVLSELVSHFNGVNTKYTIKFIAFGAEEGGLKGSEAFVEGLSDAEINNAIGMINLDSLITGDYMYANAGDNAYDDAGNEIAANVSLREAAHRIADELNIDLKVNPAIIAPGETKAYKPYGVGCCSDQESFQSVMPVVGFEATNWSLGPDFDGYTQTDNPKLPKGFTWHNPDLDNEAVLTEALGEERIKQRMSDYSKIITQLIAEQVDADNVR